jgi:hypothetical protein
MMRTYTCLRCGTALYFPDDPAPATPHATAPRRRAGRAFGGIDTGTGQTYGRAPSGPALRTGPLCWGCWRHLGLDGPRTQPEATILAIQGLSGEVAAASPTSLAPPACHVRATLSTGETTHLFDCRRGAGITAEDLTGITPTHAWHLARLRGVLL